MASIEDLRAELEDIGPDAWREKYWRFAQHERGAAVDEVKSILAELDRNKAVAAQARRRLAFAAVVVAAVGMMLVLIRLI